MKRENETYYGDQSRALSDYVARTEKQNIAQFSFKMLPKNFPFQFNNDINI